MEDGNGNDFTCAEAKLVLDNNVSARNVTFNLNENVEEFSVFPKWDQLWWHQETNREEFLGETEEKRKTAFGWKNPIAGYRQKCSYIKKAITTVATDFAINLSNQISEFEKIEPYIIPPPEEDKKYNSWNSEGNIQNAIRHTLWQAIVTKEFDFMIAVRSGNLHEETIFIDYEKRDFGYGKKAWEEADMTVDFLNNRIGRKIGKKYKEFGFTNVQMAEEVLCEFRNEGLWVIPAVLDRLLRGSEKYDEIIRLIGGEIRFTIEKRKLTPDAFNRGLEELKKLSEDGLRKKTFKK